MNPEVHMHKKEIEGNILS